LVDLEAVAPQSALAALWLECFTIFCTLSLIESKAVTQMSFHLSSVSYLRLFLHFEKIVYVLVI
jgi:hypothetical protein